MRKAIAGLTALGMGLSLAVTVVPPAGAAPPPAGPPTPELAPASDHELPNPLEDKRRALREEALTQVLNGEATPTEINGSTVVQVGEQPGAVDAAGREAPGDAPSAGASRAKNQYVELAREATDRVFVLLVEFGDERHPDYPDQDTDPARRGPGPLRRPAPQRDPRARPQRRQPHDLAAGLQPGVLRRPVLRRGRRRRVVEDLLREAVLGALQRRRGGHRLGDGAVQRGPLRPLERLPVRRHRLRQHVGAGQGRHERLGRVPGGRGPQRRGHRRRAGHLRRLRPLRLRRRRRLQRARPLRRPPADRPLGRRPGRRRSAPGRGRHLEPPLVRLGHRLRHHRPRGQPGRRHRDRRHRPVGRRLHGPARERRPVHHRPRVRARHRPAGPLRHRRRPERRRVVVPDGPEPAVRRGRAHRHPRRRPVGLGQAAEGLARLRDRDGRPGGDRRPRPPRVQHGQAPGGHLHPAGQGQVVRLRRPVRRRAHVVVRRRATTSPPR